MANIKAPNVLVGAILLFLLLLLLPRLALAQLPSTQCVVTAAAGGTSDALTIPQLPCVPTTVLLTLTTQLANATSTPTLQYPGGSAMTIKNYLGDSLAVGLFQAGGRYLLTSDGSYWYVLGPAPSVASSAGQLTPAAFGGAYGGDVQIAVAGAGATYSNCKVTTATSSHNLIVTGTGCTPFTADDAGNGKIMIVNDAGATDTQPWIGTITAYVSAVEVTLSTTPGQNLTAVAEPFRWGHDEGAAINSCIAAAASQQGTSCYLPPPVEDAWGTTVAINVRPNNEPSALVGAGRYVSVIASLATGSELVETGSLGASRGSILQHVGFDAGKLDVQVGYFSCVTGGDWLDLSFFNAGSSSNADVVFIDATGKANGCGGNWVADTESWNNPAYYSDASDYPAIGLIVDGADNRFTDQNWREDTTYGIEDMGSGENSFINVHNFGPNQTAATGIYINGSVKDFIANPVCDNGISRCVYINGSENKVIGGTKQGSSPASATGVEVAASNNYNVVIGFVNVTTPGSDVVWDTPVGTDNCSLGNGSTAAPSTTVCPGYAASNVTNFSNLTTGTNNTATLTCGTGCEITTSGSGVNNATGPLASNLAPGLAEGDSVTTSCASGTGICTVINTINSQSGATYTILSSDAGKTILDTYSSGAAAYSLPQATGAFAAGYGTTLCGVGDNLILNTAVSLIGGLGEISLAQHQCIQVLADATGNYQGIATVPVPAAQDQTQYLRNDYTFTTPPTTEGTWEMSTGLITSVVNTAGWYSPAWPQNEIIDGITASFTGTCGTAPTIELLDYVQGATSNPIVLATVTTVSTGVFANGTVSVPGFQNGDVRAWEVSAGSCTSATIYASATFHYAPYVGPGDIQPSAFAAYGIQAWQQANLNGSTVAIQLLRASDSTTKNIVLLRNGQLDTATAAWFCQGTTCSIKEWFDLTGNGHNLTQATAADQATYTTGCTGTVPCAAFNGTSDFYAATSLTSTTWTGFDAVWSVNNINQASAQDIMWANNSDNGYAMEVGTGNQISIYGGSFLNTSNNSVSANTAYVAQGYINSGGGAINQNNATETTGTTGSGSAETFFAIMANGSSPSAWVAGKLYNFGVFASTNGPSSVGARKAVAHNQCTNVGFTTC